MVKHLPEKLKKKKKKLVYLLIENPEQDMSFSVELKKTDVRITRKT